MSSKLTAPIAADSRQLLTDFIATNASDLYVTVGSAPMVRISHSFEQLNSHVMSEHDVEAVIAQLLPPQAVKNFREVQEYNSAIDWQGKARMRINLYMQRQMPAIVIRRIVTNIPTLDELKLPRLYADLIMEKRGLVLVVGPTGSGKSTSLASMIHHRNIHGSGHIVTIEDPIEFIHEHGSCIVSQRDVGIDTHSFAIALKNVLRQSPDVIMIGEIRDRESMEQALVYSETGHLVLATLHASNTSQAIDRILHFFPEESQRQLLLHISLNLKGILSQRLIRSKQAHRLLAVEIMLNHGLIRELIKDGKVSEIREQVERNRDLGMQTFEQCLIDYWLAGEISDDTAIAEADVPTNMRFLMKQHTLKQRMEGMLEEDISASPWRRD